MACCKCCCGGVDCAEGDQGKCCCGGASGTCCQAGEYCCNGACQATPCDCGAPVTLNYYEDNIPSQIYCPPVSKGEVTVAVPAGCCVSVQGFVDDVLLINGQPVTGFCPQSPQEYLFESCELSPSFTVSAGDTQGGHAIYNLTVTFSQNPLP